MTHYDVLVIGAGAAGLVAAAEAASRGRRTLLLEKNKRPGVKILMSGGTRCNLTHATDKWGIIKAYGEQGNFLHSALAALSPSELVQMFEEEGVATKVEETGKIFPVSNKATDVLAALIRRLERSGAELATGEPVTSCARVDGRFLVTTRARELTATPCSSPSAASPIPAVERRATAMPGQRPLDTPSFRHAPLVPLTTDAPWVKSLTGLTIPDVQVSALFPGRNPWLRPRLVPLHALRPLRPGDLDISRPSRDIRIRASYRSFAIFCPRRRLRTWRNSSQEAAAKERSRSSGSCQNTFPAALPKSCLRCAA